MYRRKVFNTIGKVYCKTSEIKYFRYCSSVNSSAIVCENNDSLQPLNETNVKTSVPSYDFKKLGIDINFTNVIDEQYEKEKKSIIEIPKFFKEGHKISENFMSNMEVHWRKNISNSIEKKFSSEESDNFEIPIIPYLKLVPEEYITDLLIKKVYYLPHENMKRIIYYDKLVNDLGKEFHLLVNGICSIEPYKKFFLSYFNRLENTSCYLPRLHFLNMISDESRHSNSEELPWNNEIEHILGVFLTSLLINQITLEINGKLQRLITVNKDTNKLGKEIRRIYLKPALKSDFLTNQKNCYAMLSSDLPMLCPPIPWISIHEGGYLSPQMPLIRLADKFKKDYDFEAIDKTTLSPVFDAVNALSAVPWKINTEILNTTEQLFKSRQIDEFLAEECHIEDPVNDINNPQAWTLLFDTFKGKQQPSELKRIRTIKRSFIIAISIAKHFRDRVFWIPHSIDFRGRCIPASHRFHHQKQDIYQSLLIFAEGKQLSKHGLKWLKIHLVNLLGNMKENSHDDRLKYVEMNLDLILDSADNPIEGNKWWAQFDQKWRVLAACKEIAKAERSPNPEEFVSHLPVYQDGTCNFMQHLAALSADQNAAKIVNLVASDKPQDIYQYIVDIMEKMRQNDAKSTRRKEVKRLEGFVRRNVIKKTITVTLLRINKSTYTSPKLLAKQLHRSNFPLKYLDDAALYLNDILYDALFDQFVPVKEFRQWLIDCALLAADTGDSPCISWRNPIGLTVMQPYSLDDSYQQEDQKVNQALKAPSSESYKHTRAFLPNFIHSLESSHLMFTALECQKNGITLAANHDSFWTHACDVPIMGKILRQQFVHLYSQPILEDLLTDLKKSAYSKSQDKASFPSVELPKKGTFNIQSTLESEYFFN